MLSRRGLFARAFDSVTGCVAGIVGWEIKGKSKKKEITDSDILDCLVYVSEQVHAHFDTPKSTARTNLVIYMSSRLNKAIQERFDILEPLREVVCLEPLRVEINDDIDWGDGPEYTCWLTDVYGLPKLSNEERVKIEEFISNADNT